MRNRILAIMIAAGTMLSGVGVQAEAADVYFRYLGKMPTQLAAAEPEPEPEFKPHLVEFTDGPGSTEFEYTDVDGDGKISIGDTFYGRFLYSNSQPLGGDVEIRAAGLNFVYEPYESATCTIVSGTSSAGGTTTRWCRQKVTISQEHIDNFCNGPYAASYAGQTIGFMPMAFAFWKQKYLGPQQFLTNATCD